MSAERWLPVVGYEGRYEVSDRGRVRSVGRIVEFRTGQFGPHAERLLKLAVQKKGYLTVTLYSDGRARKFSVHSAVLMAFVGPRPEGLVVRHLDGCPQNNVLSNLAYGTYSENSRDAVRHGTHSEARKTSCKWGHPFSPENTRINSDGDRVCRECCRTRRAQLRAVAS